MERIATPQRLVLALLAVLAALQLGQLWPGTSLWLSTTAPWMSVVVITLAFILLLTETERPLSDEVLIDDLTGLANRAFMTQSLETACRNGAISGQHASLLMMDLDRFKIINDTLGHDAGDVVLREVAARLVSVLRGADLIGRQGGDDFLMLLPGTTGETVEKVALKIIRALEAPIVVGDHKVDVGASIGIAVYPEDGDNPRDLLREADTAMFVAKRRQQPFLRWDPGCDTNSVSELSLLGELREAIDNSELELHYQPLLALPQRRVVAAEALLRWRHPERGMIPPQEFIPFAESTRFMRTLTRWIIAESLSACARWRKQGFKVRVDVNITPQDLFDPAIVGYVRELLENNQLGPDALCLELTETAFMDHPEQGIGVMTALRDMGVALAVDDFGTGYSSLAYVSELPVSEIKIDRMFTAGLDDGSPTPIASSAIELGRKLNLAVVAEGIENEPTLEMISREGCTFAQGFHICRPLPESEFLKWLKSERNSTRGAPAAPLVMAVNS